MTGNEAAYSSSMTTSKVNNLIFSADIISCVEFNQDGELLATGDKGGRVVIFQVFNFTWKRKVLQYIL